MTATPDPAPAAREAGRALDAEIARAVFGRKIERVTQGELSVLVQMSQDGSERGLIPPYSTDIAAAWQVVERMLGRRIGDLAVVGMDVSAAQYDPDVPVSHTCMVTLATPLDAPEDATTTFDGVEETADTAPLAICRAVLAAIEGGRVDA